MDVGQVVVLGGYYRDGQWLLTDAKLFLPEAWFDAPHKKQWKCLPIPYGMTLLEREKWCFGLKSSFVFKSPNSR